MFDKNKIDRFTRLIQSSGPDREFVYFYNEFLSQFNSAELYISDLEQTVTGLTIKQSKSELDNIEFDLLKSQQKNRSMIAELENLFAEKGFPCN